MAQKLLDLWTSFAGKDWPRTSFDRKFTWSPMVSGTFGPYARIDKELTIEKDWPKEFVREVSVKREIDVRPLMALLLN